MKTLKILGFLIVLLVITSVTFSNHSLDDSELVKGLSKDISSLEHANTILRSEVARRGSLSASLDKIEAAGFTVPEQVATLSSPGQVASR